MKPIINSIYLSVQDMERAVKFYEDIFDVKISNYDERMSSFEFDNISFLLFDPTKDGEEVKYGNNAIPNIEVENADKMLELVKRKACKVVMPLEQIDNYSIFQIEDTEGNIVEFYQRTGN